MVKYCCLMLLERLVSPEECSGLVVGCGSGDEVVYMRRVLRGARVVGVDVHPEFAADARAEGCVVISKAERLPFRAETFDFAAALHSLEHVEDPRAALEEVRRVLRPEGWFYLGVPNRNRLVGYVGSFDATTWQKITWNLTDWKARLCGRFTNKAGAHAGFERQELLELLREYFASAQLLTGDFLRFKYAGRVPKSLLRALLAPGVIDYSAPAHYALCRR